MTIKNFLKKAQKEQWAIGQFNISNLEAFRAVMQAAANLKSPVIIGTSENESRFIGLKQAVCLSRAFQEEFRVPVFLNLDHGKSFEYIKKAVEAGYPAVHFDGSGLPLEKNIEITKKVVVYARKKNVLVEGEVGVIGGKLTNPHETQKFIKETKVDILAINVGTIHGIRKSGKNPPINLQRLEEIKKKIGDMPLVLHGGSGTSDKDIKSAIKLGIVKININTELRAAYTKALRNELGRKAGEIIPYKYLPTAVSAVQKAVEEKIKLFTQAKRGK